MQPATIQLIKEVMSFKNDNGEDVKISGIRVVLAPKIEKFFMLEDLVSGRKSNLDLLGYTNPDLAQWYCNVGAGSVMLLNEVSAIKEKSGGLQGIYSKQNEADF